MYGLNKRRHRDGSLRHSKLNRRDYLYYTQDDRFCECLSFPPPALRSIPVYGTVCVRIPHPSMMFHRYGPRSVNERRPGGVPVTPWSIRCAAGLPACLEYRSAARAGWSGRGTRQPTTDVIRCCLCRWSMRPTHHS